MHNFGFLSLLKLQGWYDERVKHLGGGAAFGQHVEEEAVSKARYLAGNFTEVEGRKPGAWG